MLFISMTMLRAMNATYIFAMHNREVNSKILYREKIIAIVFTQENSNLFALLSTTCIVNLQKCNIPYVDKLLGYNIMIFSMLIKCNRHYYKVPSTFYY